MGGPPKKREPDVSLTAEAKVKRLRFERVPDTGIRFRGQEEKETESGTVRENLPDESERAVVYHDVYIRLESIAVFTAAEKSPQRELEPGESG